MSEFRGAMRHPQAGQGGAIPVRTPYWIRKKAVETLHQQNVAAGLHVLDQGLSDPHWQQPGAPSTMAANTRTHFDRYVRLAGNDPRPMALVDLCHDVGLGQNDVGVRIDVVLFEPGGGYTGRLVLWEVETTDRDLAEILAAPCVRAIDERLGSGTCQTVEVWQLRHSVEYTVSRADALGALSDATNRLQIAATNTP